MITHKFIYDLTSQKNLLELYREEEIDNIAKIISSDNLFRVEFITYCEKLIENIEKIKFNWITEEMHDQISFVKEIYKKINKKLH
ncbi:hypothetical protein [Mycoplasma suis]|uniref:Uncharacterized protein n=2 Tax=Mycoplasma suis TaxID=57372 RepID=F0QS75_MYCSL|nr:hypothetical protein [Mycoplasma suis]ADX98345.1 hypothetical protein MSU_0824 [Mycoplasma suis str. Illinois]CBZ40854.1 hypothetical protein MSUIS_07610 [Mycoplasma suis KI3806]